MKSHATHLAVAALLVLGAGTACNKGSAKNEAKGSVAQQALKAKPAAEQTAGDKGNASKEGGESGSKTAAKAAQEATNQKEAAHAQDAAKAAPAKRITGPIAIVNGKPIPAERYYAEYSKFERIASRMQPERLKQIRDNILNRLIEEELIHQAIEREHIQVSDQEVDKEFDAYRKRFQSDDQFKAYLKHSKLTEKDIRKRIRDKLALEKLIEKHGSLEVSDKEAQDFYTKNQRFYQQRETVHAAHILVKLPKDATPEQEKKAKEKLAKIQAELKKGTDFAEVAKKYSEGPSAPKGGDLGYFSRGQMVKPFEEVAFKLKPGQVSDPVRTRFGYHIIKVLDHRPAKQRSFEEVKDQIKQSLRNKKFFKERRKLIDELKKAAKVEKLIDTATGEPVKNPAGGAKQGAAGAAGGGK